MAERSWIAALAQGSRVPAVCAVNGGSERVLLFGVSGVVVLTVSGEEI